MLRVSSSFPATSVLAPLGTDLESIACAAGILHMGRDMIMNQQHGYGKSNIRLPMLGGAMHSDPGKAKR
jgi:hypothetical protein